MSPLAGTIFEKSHTPLTSWFYVIYLMSQTRSGVSAMQIHRELGVTYKCAWRMMHKIRELMTDEQVFTGAVEADETFMKAKPWRDTRISRTKASFFSSPKILGLVERETGHVKAAVIPNLRSATVRSLFKEHVIEGSSIYTDGSHIYTGLRDVYTHMPRVHWGPVNKTISFGFLPSSGESTQRIENFWSVMKRGIRGVYIHVSKRHLQAYANEYAWRYSHRDSEVPMFELLLARASR